MAEKKTKKTEEPPVTEPLKTEDPEPVIEQPEKAVVEEKQVQDPFGVY